MIGGILFLLYADPTTLIFILFCTFLCKYLILFKTVSKPKISLIWFAGPIFALVFLVLKLETPISLNVINKLVQLNIATPHDYIFPLGASFVIFRAISFCTDYSKGLIHYKSSYFHIFSYLIFFPTVLSGPIILARNFNVNISCNQFNEIDLINGIKRIIWGLFKKIVIADNILSFIRSIETLSGNESTVKILLGFLHLIRLYADFSGYSDIVIGVGNIIGYKIKENFNNPFASSGPQDFWRNWHISLMEWFKEYIFIPLGGSQKGLFRLYLSIIIVFTISGLWHGWDGNFIVWGILNACLYLFYHLISHFATFASTVNKHWDNYFTRKVQIILFFSLLTIAWIPFFNSDFITIYKEVFIYKFSHIIGALTHHSMISYFITNGWITLVLTILFLWLDQSNIVKTKFVSATDTHTVGLSELILLDFFLITILLFAGLAKQEFAYFNF